MDALLRKRPLLLVSTDDEEEADARADEDDNDSKVDLGATFSLDSLTPPSPLRPIS